MMIRLNFSKFLFAALLASSCSITFSMEPVEHVNRGLVEVSRECTICLREEPEVEFRALSCGHEVCVACSRDQLQRAFQRETFNAMRDELRCPRRIADHVNPDELVRCPHEMNEMDIRLITADNTAVDRFNDRLIQDFLNKDQDIRRCPTNECQFAYSLPRVSKIEGLFNWVFGMQSFQCPSCNQEYCSDCLAPHTRFESCREQTAELLAREAEELAKNVSELLETKEFKLCPKCNFPVGKNDSCRYVTHRVEDGGKGGCGYKFCWHCLQDWAGHGTHDGRRYDKFFCRPEDLEMANAPKHISLIRQCSIVLQSVGNTRYGRYLNRRAMATLLIVSLIVGGGYQLCKRL